MHLMIKLTSETEAPPVASLESRLLFTCLHNKCSTFLCILLLDMKLIISQLVNFLPQFIHESEELGLQAHTA